MKETSYHSWVAICLKNKKTTGRDIAPLLLYGRARRLQKNELKPFTEQWSSPPQERGILLCHDFLLLHVGTICYWTNNVSRQLHANTPLVAICWRVSQRSQCNMHSRVPPVPTSSAVQCNTVHGASSYAGAWFAAILWPVWVRNPMHCATHCIGEAT